MSLYGIGELRLCVEKLTEGLQQRLCNNINDAEAIDMRVNESVSGIIPLKLEEDLAMNHPTIIPQIK